MKYLHMRVHRGATLVELLIFLAVLSMIIGITLPMFFSATENRILQQTISIVEQNGTQALQNISLRIHRAERILSPAIGSNGPVLALQTASGATNPTLVGMSSGTLVIIEGAVRETISSEQVAITDFRVTNTSTSTSRQSVHISFRVSRTIRLQQPHSYARQFETVINLLPDDVPEGDSCGCLPPYCLTNDTYEWQVCQNSACLSATTHLECP